MSLGATLSGSLLAVLDRPSTWPLALAGFLIRGGWLLVVAPIVVLPTAVGLANVIAPLLEDIAFGRRVGDLVVLIVLALVVVVGWLLGGTVLVETVFDWPGIGAMFVDSIGTRDFPIIQAIVGLVAVSVLAANLIVDLLYGVVDPRIRVEASNR